MEAINDTVDVESITELTEGDTVTVSGNGMVHTAEVALIEYDGWKDKMAATMEPTDGLTVTLCDTYRPLADKKSVSTNVAGTTVERHL